MFSMIRYEEDTYAEDIIQHKILNRLGPRDLINAKLVCKCWATVVRTYLRDFLFKFQLPHNYMVAAYLLL